MLFQTGHARSYWASAEWSFCASILFAQTVVRFVTGLVRAGGRAVTGTIALTIAIVVVLGLVPSLLVLTMTLQAVESQSGVSFWLQVFQVLLFLLSIVAYLLLGTVSEVMGGIELRRVALQSRAAGTPP